MREFKHKQHKKYRTHLQKDEISRIEMKYKIFKFKKHLFKVNQITESEINPITTLSSSRNKLFVNLFKKK